MTPMITLYRYTHAAVPLIDAAACLPGAVGYLFAPQRFWIARVEAGDLVTGKGDLALDEVYEARLATAEAELRWLRDPASGEGLGRAAMLSETPRASLPAGWTALDEAKALEAHTTPLLLTALAEGPEGEGLAAHAPRQGRLQLPWQGEAPAAQARLAWRWREYLGLVPGEAGADGNVTVIAARLAGLAAVRAKEDA